MKVAGSSSQSFSQPVSRVERACKAFWPSDGKYILYYKQFVPATWQLFRQIVCCSFTMRIINMNLNLIIWRIFLLLLARFVVVWNACLPSRHSFQASKHCFTKGNESHSNNAAAAAAEPLKLVESNFPTSSIQNEWIPFYVGENFHLYNHFASWLFELNWRHLNAMAHSLSSTPKILSSIFSCARHSMLLYCTKCLTIWFAFISIQSNIFRCKPLQV